MGHIRLGRLLQYKKWRNDPDAEIESSLDSTDAAL